MCKAFYDRLPFDSIPFTHWYPAQKYYNVKGTLYSVGSSQLQGDEKQAIHSSIKCKQCNHITVPEDLHTSEY